MEIKLKSNRKHIINFASFFCIIYSIILAFMIIGFITGFFDIFSDLLSFILVVILFICLLLLIIIANHFKGKSYIFSEDVIEIYKKGGFVQKIRVQDIDTMHYYPWRVHYLITIFAGSLNEGGAWKIHIRDKDGTKHEIGFLSEKEAVMLKDKLYPERLEIMYDKRKIKL